MKVLVAYMSKAGNTRKVSEAICEALDCEKDIMPAGEVADCSRYDLSFFGFPVQKFGPDSKAVRFLQQQCQAGRDVALFITHAAPEGEPALDEWLDKFRQAAAGAHVVGMFDCQGQLAKGTKFIMSIVPVRELRDMAKRDNSAGQPDASRLERARVYAREMLAQKQGSASRS